MGIQGRILQPQPVASVHSDRTRASRTTVSAMSQTNARSGSAAATAAHADAKPKASSNAKPIDMSNIIQ